MTHAPSAQPSHGAMSEEPTMSDAPVAVNDTLNFTATTATGDTFDGTSLAGKDSILWFWASWCPTCQAEAPGVAAAVAQLPDGVTIYGVPGNSDQAGIESFVSNYGLGDVTHIVDGDGSLWSRFGVPYQPAFALINDDGEITVIQGSLGVNGILDAANSLTES
jgi:thiol-disulfide isomerase/thioredoxin